MMAEIGETMQKKIDLLKERGEVLYHKLDKRMGGVPSILYDSFMHFSRVRGPEAAASMSYYAIFSLFPLLLAVIAIGSFFLESARLQEQVLYMVEVILPVGRGIIIDNITEVLEARTAFGITGAVGLLWAASAAFTTLFRNINRAWMRAEPLNVLKSRLVAMTLIVVLVVLMLFVRYASALINILPNIAELLGEESEFYDSLAWIFISNFVPLFLTFSIFLILFRWIPNTRVLWSEAFWGALLAALAWELTTIVFTWVLSVGLLQYQLVYGSLGTMIALMFWIYLNSFILIFSAHLTSAIARHNRPESEDVTPTKEAEEAAQWH
jgi:membrane protein